MSLKPHIVLIGMPGSGKSSVGRCLAAGIGLGFVDTDDLIQAGEGRSLNQILLDEGLSGFRRIEALYVADLSMDAPPMVIATGGSVVYSDHAMAHLKSACVIVFLDAKLDDLQRRLGDLLARGVVIAPEQGLADLFAERRPLYLKHAQFVFPCASPNPEEAAAELAFCLAAKGLLPPSARKMG
jgi:shikimate kinase